MLMKAIKMLALCCISALTIISCGNQENNPTPLDVIDPPGMIIPVQEAEDLYHTYGEKRVPLIEKTVNIDAQGNPIPAGDPAYVQATRSATIDYGQLKKYLAFIEQEAALTKTNITGLRVYFGQYANTTNAGRATVFLNPVKKYGTGGITDDVAFAIDKSRKVPKAVYVDQCYKVPGSTTNQANLIMPVQGTIQSLAGNTFPLRPPPTNDPDYQ